MKAKRAICRVFLIMVLMCLIPGYSYGEEYEKFEIKQGMRENEVNERYGSPVVAEKIKPGFFPIPQKKALYKIDESDYMILNFFSGRVSKVTILSDMNVEEATNMFRQQ